MSTTTATNQVVEHIVLFKVKPETPAAKIASMVNGLNGLTSLPEVLHLTAGALHRTRSNSLFFTHMLHTRYRSKEDLNAYTVHPSHVTVVKESIRPIIDDIMAVDWVSNDFNGPISPPANSAMRVSFLKLKDEKDENAKAEILGVVGEMDGYGSIEQLSYGENFSPDRAKGYSIGSIAVFAGLSELDALDSDADFVRSRKEKVRDSLESALVLDYVVPAAQAASL
ncbi:hypothetical protein RJ639_012227 [Escallonia herrerae]|uniref:Stress-response A/B barrel domain-containing protein n=1 Tax=Escallonia herrerae TaxID=1293975 RepID=A0AA89ATN8_9ASTE|nr:hypothetical protein RJ639_012227 [Escallonia herrerae]